MISKKSAGLYLVLDVESPGVLQTGSMRRMFWTELIGYPTVKGNFNTRSIKIGIGISKPLHYLFP